MRPLIAIMVAAVVLGTVQAFLSATATPGRATASQATSATGLFTVDVTLTFDAGPDPFALRSDEAASLLVEFRGRTLLRETGPLSNGDIITLGPVPDVEVGQNEFYLMAVPQPEKDVVHAVRVRILRDEELIAEQWLAAEPGQPVSGTLMVDVPVARSASLAGDLPAGH